ncbi:MAG: transposase [bacterium]
MSIKTNYIESSNESFHVYNRGVSREKIFIEERNYLFFEQQFEKYNDPYSFKLLAYCLMPNHYHLIIHQIIPKAISKFIGSVCKGYVQAINIAYHRTGHLFEGKYKIKHIDDTPYLLHLSRYIHLNPVRARLVEKAVNWPYSSCKEYYGLRNFSFVTSDFVLNQIGSFSDYERYIKEYKPEEREKIKKYLF